MSICRTFALPLAAVFCVVICVVTVVPFKATGDNCHQASSNLEKLRFQALMGNSTCHSMHQVMTSLGKKIDGPVRLTYSLKWV